MFRFVAWSKNVIVIFLLPLLPVSSNLMRDIEGQRERLQGRSLRTFLDVDGSVHELCADVPRKDANNRRSADFIVLFPSGKHRAVFGHPVFSFFIPHS